MQEVSTIKNETMQTNDRFRSMKTKFNQDLAPVGLSQMILGAPSNAVILAESMLVVDQQARTRLTIAPNRLGPREITLNPTIVLRAGLRLRYDVMLQVLHAQKFPGSAPLTAGQLKTLRLAMHHEALKLLPIFLVTASETTGSDQLDAEGQLFFTLLLEDKMFASAHQLETFHCQKQWCARGFISEAQKIYRFQLTRA
ncbi:hypothetical protein [Parasitella parasitica]|uniref:Uncharacterized protein n=1 Tax=Parasitella parasitica TaxID=35722 RepID=A0A0B7NKU5_9FUNG|nr:hypothetical protein [Parasitella parasitica]